ncbi:RNA polymerase sigma factor (sigma-70 family) [Diaminobutyricimonas aerilata]|uniref:RNA polymerase sigma factor (Sigma-70 family) n=1 Tax=Diaminobutyricimonas aerilata TaxID=1162967 RepID=A0A2M9CH30_9MICO|nr:sigma-70 family RNA polymerase sigma factor [Diaminobutyricimonas aerilata]PJJ71170.1 RNA polymerase sigma factor (sigma-70 family) [Diaminobutyricimonas aerilata]
MSEEPQNPQGSDQVLVAQARGGNTRAYAELWRRHHRAGFHVARRFTSIDADDLVSEAFARILKRIQAGGGPTGAFRPYLYTTIRNLASTWGAARREIAVDEFDDLEEAFENTVDPAMQALDRTLVARAFRALPDRWQTVLWYTEVEGMDPHEVAPLLGISANGVAALGYRAREGLRRAWLQAHIADAALAGECAWASARMGDHARSGLSRRDAARFDAHVAECKNCTRLSEEVRHVGADLGLVLLPLLLGGTAGVALSGSAAAPDAAASALPDLPFPTEIVGAAGSAVAAPVAAGLSLGAATGTTAMLGSAAIVVAVGGGIVGGGIPAGVAVPVPTETTPIAAEPVAGTPAGPSPYAADPSTDGTVERPGGGAPAPDDPANIPGPLAPEASTPDAPGGGNGLGGVVGGVGNAVGGVVGGVGNTVGGVVGGVGNTVGGVVGGVGNTVGGVVGGVGNTVGGVVGGVVDTVTGGTPPPGHTAPGGPVAADIALNLGGTATPGAHLSLQAGGQVYATATVDRNGRFTLAATAIPAGTARLSLVQQVDRDYLGGLVGGVLGAVDSLVNALIKPVVITTPTAGIRIDVIG